MPSHQNKKSESPGKHSHSFRSPLPMIQYLNLFAKSPKPPNSFLRKKHISIEETSLPFKIHPLALHTHSKISKLKGRVSNCI